MYSKCSAYPLLEGFSDMPISRQKSWDKNKLKNNLPAPPSPPPPPVKRRRGNVYVNLTLIVFRDVTLAKKYTITLYWLTPFVDSFVSSDFLELIIYFHTNEYSRIVQMIVKDDRGKAIAWQIVSDNMTCYHFSDKKKNSLNPQSAFCTQSAVCILYLFCILYQVCSLHFVLTGHWYVFRRERYLRFVTNWLRKIFDTPSSASDRSPLSSRRNRSV